MTRMSARLGAIGTATAVVGAFAFAASAQAAAIDDATTMNPFEGSGGFTVVAHGDASLGNGELEGSIAVTGTISSSKQNYPVRHQAAGSGDYTIPIVDGDPTRVLAGGFAGEGENGIAITNSGEGGDTAENQGIAKLVSVDGLTASSRGSDWTRVTGTTGGIMDLEALPYEDGVLADRVATLESSVEAYLDVSAYAAAQQCLADGYASATAADPGDRLVNVVAANAQGGLAMPGPFANDRPNVFEYEEFAGVDTVKPDNFAGYVPSAQAPLIIRVPAGTTEVDGIRIEGWSASHGAQQDYAQYVMYDLSEVAGDVTIGAIEIGAVFAPNADVTFPGTVTNNGQWVTRDLVTGGGGELHHYLFGGNILCALDEPDAADGAADAADADAADGADGTDAADGSDVTDGVDAADGVDATDDADGVDAADGAADGADGTDAADGADVTDGVDADGVDAADDVDVTDGVDTADGVDATDDADGVDATDGSDVTDGVDATDDADGTDAADGADTTDGVDTADGVDATDDADGVDATDGADATDATDGTDGADSTDGTDATTDIDAADDFEDQAGSDAAGDAAAGDHAAADASDAADAGEELATTGGGAPVMLLGAAMLFLLAGAATGLLGRARREA